MTGKEIIAEWERRQNRGDYKSYEQSMADMARMIDAIGKPDPYSYPEDSSYKSEQTRWREAGFNAYNCDNVDEFPTW